MANSQVAPLFWQGSGSSPIGLAPQGVFDDDEVYEESAPKFAQWAALRLGYPVMEVEMTDQNFYACFEEAIIEYAAQVNEYNMRENLWLLQGQSTGSSVTQTYITTSPLANIIEMSLSYGTEAGSGGNVDYKRFGVPLTASVQDYDLKQYVSRDIEGGKRIQIRRILHGPTPAVSRIYDPFGMGGAGGLLGSAGLGGGYTMESSYLLTPMYETLLRTQAIEFNDQVRRSQYSFEIANNRLRLFPIPNGYVEKVWVEYTVTADSFASASNGSTPGSVISDYSNAPYRNIQYGTINDVGRRWIWRFGLAICKETLGTAIRAKYNEIPIPNSTVRMNGELLMQEASQEKDKLWEQLRETLEKTGRKAQLEAAKENAENAKSVMAGVPLIFYIA